MTSPDSLHIGFVVYGGLDGISGGYRYDRKLRAYLESCGDTVEVIDITGRSYPRNLADGLSRRLRTRLDRPFDVLLQDELCHPSLVAHNRHLTAPGRLVALAHLLRYPDPGQRLSTVYRAIERRYLDGVDGVICTSRYTERAATRLSSTPSTVAYPAGRTSQPRTDGGDGPFEVVFAGSLTPRKGTATLVEALAGLSGPWHATILGDHTVDQTYAASVRDSIGARGLEDRVSVPGVVSEGRLDAALTAADVLVVPSRYEGFGMVYLEAMERGTVPVAGRVGGPGEFITHGENGFLVDPGDSAAIREILDRLRSNPGRHAALSRAAVTTARSHPDWTDSLQRARRFLLELVEGSRSADSKST